MDNRQKAHELWTDSGGSMPLKDIAEQLGLPLPTVKSWKQRDSWGKNIRMQTDATTKDASRRRKTRTNEKIVEKVGLATSLTELERDFCMQYLRDYNATQAAYRAGYSGTYGAVKNYAWNLLQKHEIRSLIKSLKELKRLSIMADVDDMIELQMRIAFSDIGNFVDFGQREVPVMGPFGPVRIKDNTGQNVTVMKTINYVDFKAGAELDTQLISEISQGKDGARLKLASRDKALDFLERYFISNPMDKHRIKYDKAKLDIEKEKLELEKRKAGMSDDVEQESGIAYMPGQDMSLMDNALPDPDDNKEVM